MTSKLNKNSQIIIDIINHKLKNKLAEYNHTALLLNNVNDLKQCYLSECKGKDRYW